MMSEAQTQEPEVNPIKQGELVKATRDGAVYFIGLVQEAHRIGAEDSLTLVNVGDGALQGALAKDCERLTASERTRYDAATHQPDQSMDAVIRAVIG